MWKVFLISFIVWNAMAWDSLVATGASGEAWALYNRLQKNYATHMISGQFDYWDQLKAKVGKTPVLQGFDMQNYSPHNPWHDDWSCWDDGTVDKAINFYKSTGGKGIVQFQWHWFSPMGGNLRSSIFYTSNTNFDVSRAVIVGTAEYTATIRDIDAIAVQLKRLQANKIPVLWRPLHEAGGRWFWWGAKGPAACKALYEIMFQRLNTYHKLNNLIWVWSTPEAEWYPGANRVDLIGHDSYPGAYKYDCDINMYMTLHKIVNGSKLIALTENGPIPNVDTCWAVGAHWNFFMSWSDLVVQQNSDQHLKFTYSSPKVYTLENIDI